MGIRNQIENGNSENPKAQDPDWYHSPLPYAILGFVEQWRSVTAAEIIRKMSSIKPGFSEQEIWEAIIRRTQAGDLVEEGNRYRRSRPGDVLDEFEGGAL